MGDSPAAQQLKGEIAVRMQEVAAAEKELARAVHVHTASIEQAKTQVERLRQMQADLRSSMEGLEGYPEMAGQRRHFEDQLAELEEEGGRIRTALDDYQGAQTPVVEARGRVESARTALGDVRKRQEDLIYDEAIKRDGRLALPLTPDEATRLRTEIRDLQAQQKTAGKVAAALPTESELPSPAPGHVRLWRGEPPAGQVIHEVREGQAGVVGRWFSHDPSLARAMTGQSGQGRIHYVDIPEAEFEKIRGLADHPELRANAGPGASDLEEILPDKFAGQVRQARPDVDLSYVKNSIITKGGHDVAGLYGDDIVAYARAHPEFVHEDLGRYLDSFAADDLTSRINSRQAQLDAHEAAKRSAPENLHEQIRRIHDREAAQLRDIETSHRYKTEWEDVPEILDADRTVYTLDDLLDMTPESLARVRARAPERIVDDIGATQRLHDRLTNQLDADTTTIDRAHTARDAADRLTQPESADRLTTSGAMTTSQIAHVRTMHDDLRSMLNVYADNPHPALRLDIEEASAQLNRVSRFMTRYHAYLAGGGQPSAQVSTFLGLVEIVRSHATGATRLTQLADKITGGYTPELRRSVDRMFAVEADLARDGEALARHQATGNRKAAAKVQGRITTNRRQLDQMRAQSPELAAMGDDINEAVALVTDTMTQVFAARRNVDAVADITAPLRERRRLQAAIPQLEGALAADINDAHTLERVIADAIAAGEPTVTFPRQITANRIRDDLDVVDVLSDDVVGRQASAGAPAPAGRGDTVTVPVDVARRHLDTLRDSVDASRARLTEKQLDMSVLTGEGQSRMRLIEGMFADADNGVTSDQLARQLDQMGDVTTMPAGELEQFVTTADQLTQRKAQLDAGPLTPERRAELEAEHASIDAAAQRWAAQSDAGYLDATVDRTAFLRRLAAPGYHLTGDDIKILKQLLTPESAEHVAQIHRLLSALDQGSAGDVETVLATLTAGLGDSPLVARFRRRLLGGDVNVAALTDDLFTAVAAMAEDAAASELRVATQTLQAMGLSPTAQIRLEELGIDVTAETVDGDKMRQRIVGLFRNSGFDPTRQLRGQYAEGFARQQRLEMIIRSLGGTVDGMNIDDPSALYRLFDDMDANLGVDDLEQTAAQAAEFSRLVLPDDMATVRANRLTDAADELETAADGDAAVAASHEVQGALADQGVPVDRAPLVAERDRRAAWVDKTRADLEHTRAVAEAAARTPPGQPIISPRQPTTIPELQGLGGGPPREPRTMMPDIANRAAGQIPDLERAHVAAQDALVRAEEQLARAGDSPAEHMEALAPQSAGAHGATPGPEMQRYLANMSPEQRARFDELIALSDAEPPPAPGTVRLWRGDPTTPTLTPAESIARRKGTMLEWVDSTPQMQARQSVQGRWFTEERDLAATYPSNRDPDELNVLSYVDVPEAEYQQLKGLTGQPEDVRGLSVAPEAEVIVPEQYMAQVKTLGREPPPSTGPLNDPVATAAHGSNPGSLAPDEVPRQLLDPDVPDATLSPQEVLAEYKAVRDEFETLAEAGRRHRPGPTPGASTSGRTVGPGATTARHAADRPSRRSTAGRGPGRAHRRGPRRSSRRRRRHPLRLVGCSHRQPVTERVAPRPRRRRRRRRRTRTRRPHRRR